MNLIIDVHVQVVVGESDVSSVVIRACCFRCLVGQMRMMLFACRYSCRILHLVIANRDIVGLSTITYQH